MIPTEAILGTIAALGTLTSMLFGGGLLKGYITHSNEMAVQRHEIEQANKIIDLNQGRISKLELDQALQGQQIQTFERSILKLELIPEINSRLASLESLLTHMKEQIKDFRAERNNHDRTGNSPATGTHQRL